MWGSFSFALEKCTQNHSVLAEHYVLYPQDVVYHHCPVGWVQSEKN